MLQVPIIQAALIALLNPEMSVFVQNVRSVTGIYTQKCLETIKTSFYIVEMCLGHISVHHCFPVCFLAGDRIRWQSSSTSFWHV